MDINNQNEVVGNYSVGDTGGFYIVLDSNDPGSGNSQVEDLDGKVIFPVANRTTAKVWTASSINENGWIGGSYSPDGSGGATRPMLYIPNDVNNNQVPDIREIMVARINGTGELDVNGNWLLDSSEQMRVGLFGPNGDGVQSKADQIGDVQVVRLMGFNQGILYNVVNNNGCASKANTFNHWGYENSAEVIINSRTIDPTPGLDLNFDFLLSSSANNTGLTTQKNLDNIRVFAYRFARCIDGMQFGNEMFTGPGKYYIHAGDLPHYPSYDGSIRDITDASIFTEAANLVFTQLANQVEAARIGSALAGRPLRIFSPAVAAGMTKPGYCGSVLTSGTFGPDDSDFGATAINALVNYANDNRLIVDQHTNYTSLADFQETVDKITGVFSDGQSCTQSPWGSPDFVASLENGPIPTSNTGWWDDNSDMAKTFFADGHTCDPDHMWDKYFVDGWFQVEFNSYYPLPEVFSAAALANLQYVCVNTTQQGIQSDGSLSKTVMGTLIADLMHPTCVDDVNLFMPIKTDYENAAGAIQIIPFVPHPNPCDSSIVCPPQ